LQKRINYLHFSIIILIFKFFNKKLKTLLLFYLYKFINNLSMFFLFNNNKLNSILTPFLTNDQVYFKLTSLLFKSLYFSFLASLFLLIISSKSININKIFVKLRNTWKKIRRHTTYLKIQRIWNSLNQNYLFESIITS